MNLTVVKDGKTDVAALWTYARHLETKIGLLRLALEEIIQLPIPIMPRTDM